MTTVAAEYDHMDLQQQYSETVNNRWDDEWDNENSSARLFERSRIKALAGEGEELCCESCACVFVCACVCDCVHMPERRK